ncbi:hypothetical protein ACHAWF_017250 [Thalassiosira exigua]
MASSVQDGHATTTCPVFAHPLGAPLGDGLGVAGGGGSGNNNFSNMHHPRGAALPPNAAPAPRSRRRRGGQPRAAASFTGPTSSHPQPPASDAARRMQRTKQLPRSVRWRLSLGLLARPPPPSASEASEGGEGERERFLKSIGEVNALKLRCQRSRYEELERRHYWRSTPVGIASDEAGGARTGTGGEREGCKALDEEGGGGALSPHLEEPQHVAPGDDPLSSALLSNGGRASGGGKAEDRKQLNFAGIFGGARPPPVKKSSLAESFTSQASSDGGSNNGDEAACKGSRWGDFYSTREVLDVIEKDLNRLPADHHAVFHEWRTKVNGWTEHRKRGEEWQREQAGGEGAAEGRQEPKQERQGSLRPSASLADVSSAATNNGQPPPTRNSAWNLGQSLKMALTKTNSVDNMAAMLEIDDDELAEEQRREAQAKAEVQASIEERAVRISRILFVYAREHPEVGYRQGMHEILSYVLLALEMDLLEQSVAAERRRWRRTSLSYGISNGVDGLGDEDDGTGGMAGLDAAGNVVVVRLLDPDRLLHDAFTLFECVMTSLAPAYDAIPAGDDAAAALLERAKAERGENPMEAVTSSVVSKLRYVARDERLFGHVLYMPVPPQLYLAKWIRLMFCREVAGGTKSVLTLWGAFFDLASAKASSSSSSSGDGGATPQSVTAALLDVLKTSAASMILMIRDLLLAPTMAPDGTMTGEPDPNVGIGYVMNYPPLRDIGTLVETISDLLSRERKIANQYQQQQLVAGERRLSKQYLPSESYKISSITEHPLHEGGAIDESGTSREDQAPLSLPQPNGGQDNGNVDRQDDFSLRGVDDELPRVYRMGRRSPSTTPSKKDVAESIGAVAEGLLDLGSKTVDFGSRTAAAALASIEEKYRVHVHTTMDHPLNDDGSPSERGGSGTDGYVIQYRPVSAESNQVDAVQSAAEETPPIEGKFPDEDSIQELIEESAGESDRFEGLDDSFQSKLSVAKSIGDSIQKPPGELASMLEKSVGTLMKHFNERMTSAKEADDIGDSQHSSSVIPVEIWDAMADIDLVRKELLSQAAIAAIDHARSSRSLRSSNNSGRGRTSSAAESRLSWQL